MKIKTNFTAWTLVAVTTFVVAMNGGFTPVTIFSASLAIWAVVWESTIHLRSKSKRLLSTASGFLSIVWAFLVAFQIMKGDDFTEPALWSVVSLMVYMFVFYFQIKERRKEEL